jgi:hypothetical protein
MSANCLSDPLRQPGEIARELLTRRISIESPELISKMQPDRIIEGCGREFSIFGHDEKMGCVREVLKTARALGSCCETELKQLTEAA